MFIRVMTVLSLATLMSCGTGGGQPDGGSQLCTSSPFGTFKAGLCDGGTTSATVAFSADGGASVSWANTGTCSVDRMGCEFLLVCDDSYKSQLSLDWTPAPERLSGSWKREGDSVPLCVVLQKQ